MNCVEKAIEAFKQKKRSMRCNEAVKTLESLGFIVEPRATKHHKSYLHKTITEFKGGVVSHNKLGSRSEINSTQEVRNFPV